MFDLFKARAEAVSAEVHRLPTKAAALDFVLDLLGREGVSTAPGAHAVWAACPFLEGVDRERLSHAGVRFDVTRETAASARVGISQMDWAVAETGTLAQDATAVDQRLVSTLPPLHLALAATKKVVPDLPALLGRLSPAQVGYLALITGPSRTADIERVLTIGVHGPARLVAVFADDLPGAAS
jgi:L-lactate dehydrogenase complex protein LldG